MSPEAVRQRILRGELATLWIGKLFRIPAAFVEAYEKANLCSVDRDLKRTKQPPN